MWHVKGFGAVFGSIFVRDPPASQTSSCLACFRIGYQIHLRTSNISKPVFCPTCHVLRSFFHRFSVRRPWNFKFVSIHKPKRRMRRHRSKILAKMSQEVSSTDNRESSIITGVKNDLALDDFSLFTVWYVIFDKTLGVSNVSNKFVCAKQGSFLPFVSGHSVSFWGNQTRNPSNHLSCKLYIRKI